MILPPSANRAAGEHREPHDVVRVRAVGAALRPHQHRAVVLQHAECQFEVSVRSAGWKCRLEVSVTAARLQHVDRDAAGPLVAGEPDRQRQWLLALRGRGPVERRGLAGLQLLHELVDSHAGPTLLPYEERLAVQTRAALSFFLAPLVLLWRITIATGKDGAEWQRGRVEGAWLVWLVK